MQNSNQIRMSFDGELRERLVKIERLADLTPVAWRTLYVTQRPGEIERLKKLMSIMGRNVHNLNIYLAAHELSDADVVLVKYLANQNLIMIGQAQEKINALKLIAERRRLIDEKR